MTPTERAEYNSILHRKAVDRLYRIANGEPLEIDELEELSMLIVRADPSDSNHYPFWVAEVGKIETDRNNANYRRVQVCWFTPIKRGKEELTTVQYLNSKFSAECSTRTDRRDKQAGHRAIKRVADWIDLESIVVVFSHLNAGGRIPAKVKNKMMEDSI